MKGVAKANGFEMEFIARTKVSSLADWVLLGSDLVPDHDPEPYWVWQQYERKDDLNC